MKKIIFLLLLLYCITFSVFGIDGDGTFGSPYSGSLTFNMTWSGTVYVNGDITVDGFRLTVSPGAIVVFLTSGSDIIITGTGMLTASGSAASMIRFTADFDNDGIYGETGERWGHISFQNMTSGFTSPSIINYCIIEFGQKYTGTFNVESLGGALYTEYSQLSISNAIIRNNYAGYGGGIFVSNASPSITNCNILNNTSVTTGGGIILYQNSPSVIVNCIIEKNTTNGGGGGGGVFIGDLAGDSRFYNCIIASNISTTNPGNNIRIWPNAPSSRPRFYNTIVWGSNNSIDYFGLPIQATDFNYCAIQGYTTGYTSCINLSATNNDPAGPNFINVTPGSENYQIIYNSPCRDAGTATGAPSTDFLGKFRIGLPDIGAYEVQYSNWTGLTSTTWTTASNWEASVDPASGSGDVIIPFISGATPNYPTGTPAPNFTIGTGKTMILKPGAEATLGALTNNGILRLEESVSGISSLIFSSYSGNSADIQLYLPGGGGAGTYKWHYISSPVTTLSASVFSGTLDLARYDESLITSDQNNGWVASDGWVYLPAPGHFEVLRGFSDLDVGHGYNHYLSSNHTYTFSGSFNTGPVIVPLAYNSIGSPQAYPNAQGFNLLGNPYPSCLDWGQIDGTLGGSISQAIYFNKMGGVASWVNGVGSNGGTGNIPPMQGFFVKAYATGTSVTLPAIARVHSVDQIRYKKGVEIIPLVRLKIEDQLNSDDAVVRFDDKATTAVDNAFDALKFSKTGSSVDIWTTTGGADLSINGLPFPDPEIEIPVSIYSNIAGNLKISGSQIDGLENYSVTLTDNVNNITINLKTTPDLSFNSPGGIVANRFTLKISAITTAIPETPVSDKPFNIYSSKGLINIQTLNDAWNGKSVGIKIMDMTGRIVTSENNIVFSRDVIQQVETNTSSGIYLVEIRSGLMKYVGKVVIR